MKLKLCGIFTLPSMLLILNCSAQQTITSPINDSLTAQALRMTNALIKREYAAFIEFTHPKIIEMFGGKLKAMDPISKSWKEQDADSILIEKITLGEPSKIINYKRQLQCTITQRFQYKSPHATIIIKSTLIAVSFDGGSRWYFIDVVNKTLQQVQQIFSDISDDLVISEQEKPEVIRN